MDEEAKKPAAVAENKMEVEEPAGVKETAAAADSEDVEMMPVRRRANKKRRVQRDSSVDEDEAMAATENQANDKE